MKIEYEVRILGIDPEEIKNKLLSVGAIYRGDFYMRRCVYDIPGRRGQAWVRLRQNDIKTTLAFKIRSGNGIKGVAETEVRVDSFTNTKQILDNLNLEFVAWQENKRISYQLGELEFCLDTWPLLAPHLEIEGPNETAVKKGVALLGYTFSQTTTKTMVEIYKDRGIDLHKYKKLTFVEQT
jgi:adenylate cyclase, class 2